MLSYDRIHLNPHVLGWIRVEISLSSTPVHHNTGGLMWIQLHPNKTYVYLYKNAQPPKIKKKVTYIGRINNFPQS